MEAFSIFIFFITTYFLGFTATRFVKNSDNFLESTIMRIGIGIPVFIVVGLLLNLVGIPLDWRIFLFIGVFYPVVDIIRKKGRVFSAIKPKITKADIFILIAILIFSVHLYMMVQGSFSYNYLEDDDPWSHAMGIKYVSVEKTLTQNPDFLLQYIDPYPPAYDLLMGVIHQTNDSLNWSMKFFNALIISLSLLFFYFFTKQFTSNKEIALFATLVLASLPAYLTHFIWALALAMPLYFIAFYAYERIKLDRKWIVPAAIATAAGVVVTPTHSTYFLMMLAIYLGVRIFVEKRILKNELAAFFGGGIISFVLWWLPMIIKYGLYGVIGGVGYPITIVGKQIPFTLVGGTADRAYSLGDFLFPNVGLFTNTPGIGLVAALLSAVAIIFIVINFSGYVKSRKSWFIIALVWFFFSLYAVMAADMPVKLSPFRAWMVFAIPVSILCGLGVSYINSLAVKFNIPKIILTVIFAALIIFTVGTFRWEVNTSQWSPGGFWGTSFQDRQSYIDEIQGYISLKDNIPPNTRVIGFGNPAAVVGTDNFMCAWCPEVIDMRKNWINMTAEEIDAWFRINNYSIFIIGAQEQKYYSNSVLIDAKRQELREYPSFIAIYDRPALTIFQLA